jgi:hypothetical protein
MPNQGFFLLFRKYFEGNLWNASDVKFFHKREAFLDMMFMAQYKDGDILHQYGNVKLKRGQILTSYAKLGTKWNWSRTKVRNFLNFLEKIEKNIIVDKFPKNKKDTQFIIITLCNYCFYQDYPKLKEQQKNTKKTAERQQKDSRKTPEEHQKDIYKESNEGNEINIRGKPPNYIYRLIQYWNDHSTDYKIEKNLTGTYSGAVTGLIKNVVKQRGYDKIISCLDVHFKIKDDVKYYHTSCPITDVLCNAKLDKLDPDNDPYRNLMRIELQKPKDGLKKVMQSERQNEIDRQAEKDYQKTQEYLDRMKED